MNLNKLLVYYHSSPKAWINSLIFKEILQYIDNKFRVQDKKILLLVDNAPSHFDPHEDEQDNNTDDNIEHDNFGEGSTSSSTSRLRGNFRKSHAKMSKSKHGNYC